MILARLGLLLCTLAPLTLAMGCGGGTLAEPAPCVTPAPLPTGTPGLPQARQYLSTVRSGIDRIKKLRTDQRSLYPERTFSRSSEFRTQFAAYADASVCAAAALRDLKPPTTALQPFDDTLDAALNQFIDHMKFGREAVRKRNVTEYREWFDGVDAKIDTFPPVPSTPGRGGGPP
jgi:hypothetical protein